jgi:hypothetical protein
MTVDLHAVAAIVAGAILLATVLRHVRRATWTRWFEWTAWLTLLGLLALMVVACVTAPPVDT